MHQVKLNICQPISSSSGSIASVFTIVGVTSEGHNKVDSLRRPKYLMYSSRYVGWAWSGREVVIEASWCKYLLVWGSRPGISSTLPNKMSLIYLVMPLKLMWFTRDVFMSGFFPDILIFCLISLIENFPVLLLFSLYKF